MVDCHSFFDVELAARVARELEPVKLARNEGLRMFPTDIEVLRLHYAWTLDAWYDRTVAAKDAIVALGEVSQ